MKKVLTWFALAALCTATLLPVTPVHSQPSPSGSSSAGAQFVPDEILVQFKAGVSEGEMIKVRSSVGAVRKEILRATAAGVLEVARIPPSLSVPEVISYLQAHPAVQFAEPNWIYTHQATSNDTLYTNGSLWGMYSDDSPSAVGPSGTTNQYGSQAEEAWANDRIGSDTVYVGVIDEGIDLNHPDLNDNVWTNPFDPVDGVDNDGNGYVDDKNGWDFFQNNNSIYDGAPGDNDTDSHGTHVSGTIGGEGGNGAGVAGVNWNVTIISGKFLGPSGGTTDNAIKSVDYFTDLKNRHGLNIVATNNSWGGGGYSQGLHAAIIRGAKAGILFCAAAGNGNFFGQPINNDTTPNYPSNYNTTQAAGSETPASYDAVIAVASLTSTGAKSSFSNYGATTVDLGAPGSGIYSTTPNNTYSSFSGTSMATPHVAGAAALYRSLNSGSTALEVKNAILNQTTPTSSMSGITVTGGRLNVSNFAPAGPPPPPPSAPSNLTASAVSSSQINLAWTDSDTETGFKIERCTGAPCGGLDFTQIATVGANVTSYNNTGLGAGTTYNYRVRANNSGGDSDYSNTTGATTNPPSLPLAPSNLTASAESSSQINLAWTDNADNETAFKIERCQNASCTNFAQIATVGANVTSYNNTGLSASTTYRYRVRANNNDGDSGYSNEAEATTPAAPALPAAPSNLTAVGGAGAGQIKLDWADNSNNEDIFKIERCQGSGCTGFTQITTVGANVNTYTDGGRSSGKIYRYRVRASNTTGNSAYSNIARS
ncbi:MAG TPA: S8 family serine peptidase, partial [Abditibacteriaceae bacterium]|nr:S8 family serine peptidase [Abditibacteriaceae bacterium]